MLVNIMKLQNSPLLLVRQMDKKLKPFQELALTINPSHGWINTIRTTLNMSLQQLGGRLKMTAQGVSRLENREVDEAITLKALREAGEALDMKLVYGFVAKDGSLEKMIEQKAYEMAVKIVKRTSVTMALEDQANSSERISQSIDEMAREIKKEVPKSLWD